MKYVYALLAFALIGVLNAAEEKKGKISVLVAGFGGQGALFSGKVIAHGGVIEKRYVSWIPSYGPEMRGGTANCGVILSDQPIGSIMVETPDVLIAMNRPSLDKFESAVVSGGIIVVDSSLIDRKVERTDVQTYYVPATKMANDMGIPKMANLILLGAVFKKTGCIKEETIKEAIDEMLPAKKKKFFGKNMMAIEAGMKAVENN